MHLRQYTPDLYWHYKQNRITTHPWIMQGCERRLQTLVQTRLSHCLQAQLRRACGHRRRELWTFIKFAAVGGVQTELWLVRFSASYAAPQGQKTATNPEQWNREKTAMSVAVHLSVLLQIPHSDLSQTKHSGSKDHKYKITSRHPFLISPAFSSKLCFAFCRIK